MRKLYQGGPWRSGAVAATLAAGAMLAGSLAIAGVAAAGSAYAARSRPAGEVATTAGHPASTCHLANGIKHVVEIGFDNVHYYRDNPNVPSDLQMLPNLLHFIEGKGTLLTNNHTPLIAHTADDLLTTFTGLYGDRAGMPVSNDYQSYNKNGTTDLDGSFAYWTDPVYDTESTPSAGHDTNPSLVYSPVPPATSRHVIKPDKTTPAPWVPFTEAGCSVGEVASVDQELENVSVDIPKVFGPNSPEARQLKADPDSYKDPEQADYVGLAVHCAHGSAVCADAKGIKYGQTKPTHTAVADRLPDEPGGYHGYQALFGSRYITPVISGGVDNLRHHGYLVTDSKGALVDLFGNEIDDYYTNGPGFPGYDGINAAQSLAYTADLLESGVPVVNVYMADLHGNEYINSISGKGQPCYNAPAALGSGSACYVAQAQYYNEAFGAFFKRLAADGITSKNTLFIVSSDEGDHQAGANVGRHLKPTPANCDGARVSDDTVTPDVLCTYPAGTFGELDGNLTGLLATQEHNTTPFTLEDDTAPEFYVTGKPGPDASPVRELERAVTKVTALNPYTGKTQAIDNYIADPTEEAILHMVNADPDRTPTFAMFAKPDYYLETGPTACSGPCVQQDTGYAWDHGDYAAEINTNYIGFVGPGVRHLGLDGNQPNQGPNSAGADSGQITVADTHLKGPWTDETDIRPTLMYLTGLRDNYEHDGRVITQILAHPNRALSATGVTALGECYKQLNASVGNFAAYTLIADTRAVRSSSPGDRTYKRVDAELRALEVTRDTLALRIKAELEDAAFRDVRIAHVAAQTSACRAIIGSARRVVSHS
jgi:hypothetical protein